MENNTIHDRIKSIEENIASVALKCKREVSSIIVMAVTKKASAEQIKEAQSCGLDLFGENYIREASEKIQYLVGLGGFKIEQFHFIGHLQSNKVKKAVSLFSSIDSVDSIHLASEISKSVKDSILPYSILVEVKTSSDETKFGFDPIELPGLFEQILTMKTIKVNGLMTIGKYEGSEKETRYCFQILRETKEEIENRYKIKLPVLSMGMSHDYKIAIEEGSDMLRIGSAIFGG